MDFKNDYKEPKRKRLLLWLVGLGLCGIGVTLSYRGHMNYHGYCWEEGRYLTEQEKIRRAIEAVLRQYPPSIVPVEAYPPSDGGTARKTIPIEELKQKKWSWAQIPPEFPIPYKDVADFLLANPDCCEVRRATTVEIPEALSFFDQVTGKEFDFVRVRYSVRYVEDGKEQRLQASYYAGLSNCGKPRWSNVIPRYVEDLSKP